MVYYYWLGSLIINESINHGTQIPYIRKAIALGYDVLVANTNDNQRNGQPINGSHSPNAHANYIWEKFISGKHTASRVAIVAHSYGGVITQQLAIKYPEDFIEKVFAVGLTDSVHMPLSSGPIGKYMQIVSYKFL